MKELEIVYSQFEISLQVFKLSLFRLCLFHVIEMVPKWIIYFTIRLEIRINIESREDGTNDEDREREREGDLRGRDKRRRRQLRKTKKRIKICKEKRDIALGGISARARHIGTRHALALDLNILEQHIFFSKRFILQFTYRRCTYIDLFKLYKILGGNDNVDEAANRAIEMEWGGKKQNVKLSFKVWH